MLLFQQSKYLITALVIGNSASVYAAGNALTFTIEAPLIQESQVDANQYTLNVQDFESVPDWNQVFRAGYPDKTSFVWEGVGTYSAPSGSGQINPHIKWGAAYGEGKYLFIYNTQGASIEDNPGVTLTFDTPVGYFGFWWSAGDYANKLTVTLTDGTEIYVETGLIYDSEGFVNKKASKGGHMGSPTKRYLDQNSREPYAYLNLYAKYENRKIAKIRFHGRNFETDNHTVSTEIITDPTGTDVPMPPDPVSYTPADFGDQGRFNIQEINKIK